MFTLKAAQPLGLLAYSLSCQLGLGVSCTLFLQDMVYSNNHIVIETSGLPHLTVMFCVVIRLNV